MHGKSHQCPAGYRTGSLEQTFAVDMMLGLLLLLKSLKDFGWKGPSEVSSPILGS